MDAAVAHPYVKEGGWSRRRSLLDRPIRESKDALMPGADDRAVAQLALMQRRAAMGTAVSEGDDLPLMAGEYRVNAVDRGPQELTLQDVVLGGRIDPILRPGLKRGAVHAQPKGKRQMAAEIATDAERPRAP